MPKFKINKIYTNYNKIISVKMFNLKSSHQIRYMSNSKFKIFNNI